jgi:soluble lytic murein transglycosylase-like protein
MAKNKKVNRLAFQFILAVLLLIILVYNPLSVRLMALGTAVYFNLEPGKFYRLIGTESSYRSFAVSHQQAIGLGQIQETTAFYVKSNHKRGMLFFPLYNLKISALYLKYLLKRYNSNWSLALAAYNWGETNVDKRIRGRSIISGKNYACLFDDIPETRQFIRKILNSK